MDSTFLDAAVRVGSYLAGRAVWQAGACAWPAAGARAAFDVYAGSAGIGWFLAEVDRVAPHPALRRAAQGALRHALAAAGRTGGAQAPSFYHGQVGVACAAARAAALWDRDDLRSAAEGLLGGLTRTEFPDSATGVRFGIAGAVPALLDPSGPLDARLCRGLAARWGEQLLDRAEREPWGWSWTDPEEVNVRPLTGLGHGAAGVGRALLELFRASGDGRYGYAAEQALLYERRFWEPGTGTWYDLRHPHLTALLRQEGADGLAGRVRRDGGVTPWLGSAGFAWCHGTAGIGLARLRAYQLLGRAPHRAEAEAAVRATLAILPRQEDPGLCHGIAGSGELFMLAGRLLDRPDWIAAAGEAAGRLLEGKRLRALGPAGTPSGGAPPSGVMLGEAGAGWFLLRLADPATPSVVLPGANSPGPIAHGAAGDPGYAAARREHVHAFFGRSLAALARSGEPGAGAVVQAAGRAAAGAGPEQSAPLAVYRVLHAAASAELRPGAVDEVVEVDCTRFELLLGIADLAEDSVERWGRADGEAVPWNGGVLLQLAPRARTAGGRLLLRTGMRVEERPLGPLEALVLAGISREPAPAAVLAEQAAGHAEAAADPLGAVLVAARALYAAGAVDVLPGPTLADAAAAGIAGAVTDEVPRASLFRNGGALVRGAVGALWEQVSEPRLSGAADPLLLAWMADGAAVQLQGALTAATMEPLFREDLAAYWSAERVDERRRILGALASVLRRVFGYPPLLRAVYLSAPLATPPEPDRNGAPAQGPL